MSINYEDIPKRISKEEAIARIKKGLGVSDEEAEEIYAYDQEVEHSPQAEFDLPPEKELVARKMAHTGTRERKAPTTYKLEARKRKPNATKGAIIAALVEYLTTTESFAAESVEAANPERMIKFSSGGENFELTLIQKRKPKA